MVIDFDNNLKEFLNSLIDEAMKELRVDNFSFMVMEENEEILYESTEKIIEKLSEDDRKILESYLECKAMVNGQELEFMYYQGIKDAVRFLKFFIVL